MIRRERAANEEGSQRPLFYFKVVSETLQFIDYMRLIGTRGLLTLLNAVFAWCIWIRTFDLCQ